MSEIDVHLDLEREIDRLRVEKHATILAHYYAGTTIATIGNPQVRVLVLQGFAATATNPVQVYGRGSAKKLPMSVGSVKVKIKNERRSSKTLEVKAVRAYLDRQVFQDLETKG